jgi:2',3'-cyclic-nucleotide 2'-phosphodiesterase/3'-nucleotidase
LGQDGKPFLTNNKAWLKNQPYNFDSAAGLDYIVDASKPEGNKVSIIALSDGRKFEEQKKYRVALNSYRGTGGGGHLTEGAGLNNDELRSRLISSTDRDFRYYIMKSIEEKKTVNPGALNNWKIVPETWVKSAVNREFKLLFGDEK